MIVKPFEESPMTQGQRALARRLIPSHPLYAKISRELQQSEAGDHGEQFIVRQLEKLSHWLDLKVLHNVAIQKPMPMQLDVVIITPSEVIIVESKNIRGHIQLKMKPRQMVRVLDNGDRGIFNHPEIQLEEYVYNLSEFFNRHHVKVNVEGIVIFPFNNASIDYEDGQYPILVLRELANYLRQRNSKNPSVESRKIIQLLLHHHQPFSPFPLCHYYKIDPKYIKQGVICPNCQCDKMQREQFKWICPQCQHQDVKAHVQALHDYSLLISNQITNKDAQQFLCLSNRHHVKRMLQSTCVEKHGVTSKTMYQILK